MAVGGRLIRRVVPLMLAIVVALLPPIARLAPVAHADCAAEFGPGLANLRNAVGEAMGQPIDCETAIDAAGDSMQHTSTGTSWFIGAGAQSDAIFTDGYHRWELD